MRGLLGLMALTLLVTACGSGSDDAVVSASEFAASVSEESPEVFHVSVRTEQVSPDGTTEERVEADVDLRGQVRVAQVDKDGLSYLEVHDGGHRYLQVPKHLRDRTDGLAWVGAEEPFDEFALAGDELLDQMARDGEGTVVEVGESEANGYRTTKYRYDQHEAAEAGDSTVAMVFHITDQGWLTKYEFSLEIRFENANITGRTTVDITPLDDPVESPSLDRDKVYWLEKSCRPEQLLVHGCGPFAPAPALTTTTMIG